MKKKNYLISKIAFETQDGGYYFVAPQYLNFTDPKALRRLL